MRTSGRRDGQLKDAERQQGRTYRILILVSHIWMPSKEVGARVVEGRETLPKGLYKRANTNCMFKEDNICKKSKRLN